MFLKYSYQTALHLITVPLANNHVFHDKNMSDIKCDYYHHNLKFTGKSYFRWLTFSTINISYLQKQRLWVDSVRCAISDKTSYREKLIWRKTVYLVSLNALQWRQHCDDLAECRSITYRVQCVTCDRFVRKSSIHWPAVFADPSMIVWSHQPIAIINSTL